MRFLFLFRKEWREIFRQKEMVVLLFIAPILQTIILGYVVRPDVTNLPVGIINLSRSIESQRLINRLASSPLFKIRFISLRPLEAEEIFKEGKSKALIVFQDRKNKANDNFSLKFPEVQILLDGSDANSAMIAAGYFYGLFGQYVATHLYREGKAIPFRPRTVIRFNPALNSLYTMGPAIVALLLTIITLLLTGIGLVREKEQQTLDILLISKLTPFEIFLGKTLPMAAIGLMEMTLGIIVVRVIFGIEPRGNLAYLYLAAAAFLFSIISIGFLISLLSQSQQQALFFCWFTMLLFLMLSGLLTPLENIPPAFRWLTAINPLRYLIAIIREIFLKGHGPIYLWSDILIMTCLGFGAFIFSLSVFRRSVLK